jgi:hypothetical protein
MLSELRQGCTKKYLKIYIKLERPFYSRCWEYDNWLSTEYVSLHRDG